MAARSLTVLALVGMLGSSCAESRSPAAEGREVVRVELGGKTFKLELALDDPTRVRGLSHREHIPEDGGMLFVFPDPMPLSFVMRHCVVPIDIAFLDPAGRVLAVHSMKVEEPKREGETDWEYEARLTRYESRFPAQFALETAGGRLSAVGLKPGDLVRIDAAGLKRRAR